MSHDLELTTRWYYFSRETNVATLLLGDIAQQPAEFTQGMEHAAATRFWNSLAQWSNSSGHGAACNMRQRIGKDARPIALEFHPNECVT